MRGGGIRRSPGSRRIVAWAAAGTLAATAAAAVEAGDAAPNVTLHRLSGETFRLADMRGTPMVLAFWATWCRRCVAELDHLTTVRSAYPARKLEIIAVSVDEDREDLDDFLEDREYPFTMCHDPDGIAVGRFRDAEDLPVTAVIDAAGVIRYLSREFPDGADTRLDAAIAGVAGP